MATAQGRSYPAGRPRSITLVALGILLIGLINLWRAAAFARQGDLLQELDVKPSYALQMVLAFVWAALLIASASAIWYRWAPIRVASPVLIALYGSFQLGFQALFTRTEVALQGRAVAALLYGLAVLVTLWALNRRAGRTYLAGRNEERYVGNEH